LQETDGANTTTKEYTSMAEQYGNLVSAFSGGQSTYYEYDGLGSTDALVSDAQAATDRYRYRAFGLETQYQGTSANDFNFVGQKGYFSDPEISLYFVRARSYDYALGRWVSEDPMGYAAGDANLYRYVGNNPVNGVDPNGLRILVKTCQGFGLDIQSLSWALLNAFKGEGINDISDVNLQHDGTKVDDYARPYYSVNFQGIPPELWERANRCREGDCSNLGPSASDRAKDLNDILQADYIVMTNTPGDDQSAGDIGWYIPQPKGSGSILKRVPTECKKSGLLSPHGYIPDSTRHTPSWLWLSEIRQALEHSGLREDQLAQPYQVLLETMESVERHMKRKSRLVFWFDN
jgi:RHS repeat-associated protein